MFKLRCEGKLNIEDKIRSYLNPKITQNLHVFKGVDYSEQLTIKHLLAHTSGIPDYFQKKGKNGKSLEDELINGKDQYWTFEQSIERSINQWNHCLLLVQKEKLIIPIQIFNY